MKSRLLLLASLLIAVPQAHANWYLAIGWGSTNVKADLSSLGGGNIDDTTGLTDFYGGYRFNKFLGVEAAYLNLARVSVGSVGVPPNNVSGSVDMRAFTASAVFNWNVVKHTNLYAKIGAANWKADLVRNDVPASTDGTDPHYGIGASYDFSKQLFVTLEFDVIDSSNPEFSTGSIGFGWNFR